MRNVLAGMLVVVAFAVAGCGGGGSSPGTTSSSGNGETSKPATQVLTDAVKAADAASSLRLAGNVSSNGQQTAIDLSVAKGKGATGSVTVKGQKVELVVVGSNGYMKGGTAFWTQFAGSNGATIAQLLAGRWLKFPVNNAQFQPIVAFSDPQALFDSLQSGASSALKNDGATTYKGQSVVALNDGAKNGTLYVSATGTPYPVALVKTGSGGGAIAFSDWNQSVSLTTPTNVLDFSQLTG
jgi:hypothetical protein